MDILPMSMGMMILGGFDESGESNQSMSEEESEESEEEEEEGSTSDGTVTILNWLLLTVSCSIYFNLTISIPGTDLQHFIVAQAKQSAT